MGAEKHKCGYVRAQCSLATVVTSSNFLLVGDELKHSVEDGVFHCLFLMIGIDSCSIYVVNSDYFRPSFAFLYMF